MTTEERAERAVEFHGQGYNCCQSSAAALADLTELDPDKLRMIGAGFAGGMGDTTGVCGALVGAVMIAGAATEGKGTVFKARAISEMFRSLSGAVICGDLKGVRTGIALCPCDDCIRNAVRAYCSVMD